jgi:hypothetical protein
MDADTVALAHPGFVEIIRNLSPDEARIMRLFSVRSQFPVVDIHAVLKEYPHRFETRVSNFSPVGREACCEHTHLTQAYIDNLCRLRLLEILSGVEMIGPNAYEPLESDTVLDEIKKQIEDSGHTLRFQRKILSRTVWGMRFCEACVIEKGI